MELTGARVLVVGSDGGLGSALVSAFRAAGAEVVSAPGPSHPDGFDVSSAESRRDLCELTAGGVDVVVVACGVVGFGPCDAADEPSVRSLLEVDLLGPLLFVGEIAAQVVTGGRIVVLTGAVVDVPTMGLSHYTAAKAGLSAALRVIRRELRPRKVGVLDVRPPHTETGLATRPRFGAAPRLPVGLSPDAVAACVVAAVRADEDELAPSAFAPV